jgi:hypothetical protein
VTRCLLLKGDAENRLDQIPGGGPHLEAVCCDAGRTILYVGIEGAVQRIDFQPPQAPQFSGGDRGGLQPVSGRAHASRRGSTDEDLTHGHPLMADRARAVRRCFRRWPTPI